MAIETAILCSYENQKFFRPKFEGSKLTSLDLSNLAFIDSGYSFLLPDNLLYAEFNTKKVKLANLKPLNVITSALNILALFTIANVNLIGS